MGLLQVEVRLQAKPEPLAGTKRNGQSHCRIGADAALAKDDLINPPRRHTGGASQSILADTQWRKKLLEQYLARVDVGELLHVSGNPISQR